MKIFRRQIMCGDIAKLFQYLDIVNNYLFHTYKIKTARYPNASAPKVPNSCYTMFTIVNKVFNLSLFFHYQWAFGKRETPHWTKNPRSILILSIKKCKSNLEKHPSGAVTWLYEGEPYATTVQRLDAAVLVLQAIQIIRRKLAYGVV